MTDAEAPKGAPIPTLLAKAPMGVPIVSMLIFEGSLYVATTEAIFKKVGDEFQELKFVLLPPPEDIRHAALDCLTAPPPESAIAAGLAMLRGNDYGPATGAAATHDPIGWYRRMALRIWESMVRAMLEGK